MIHLRDLPRLITAKTWDDRALVPGLVAVIIAFIVIVLACQWAGVA